MDAPVWPLSLHVSVTGEGYPTPTRLRAPRRPSASTASQEEEHGDETRHIPTGAALEALEPAQEAAITLYLAGHSDTDVAAAVGVTRQTCNEWRRQHVVFMAELERRRADLWRSSAERLRSGITKAIANLLGAVEAGDLKASIALLKAVDLYGDGAMHPIRELDPETLIRQQAEAQVDREGVPRNALLAMTEHLDTAAWRQRLGEVEAELRRTYVEAEPLN